MREKTRRPRPRGWLYRALGAAALGLIFPGLLPAQTPSPPPSLPPTPTPEAPAASPGGARTEYETRLEEQVRLMNATIQRLSEQVDQLSTRLQATEARLPARRGSAAIGGSTAAPRAGAGSMTDAAPGGGPSGGESSVSEEVGFGEEATGFGPAAELPSSRFDMPWSPPNRRAEARWGPGFQIRSPNDEFDIQFHNLTQLDGRFYGISNQSPVSDTFGIARQWFVFNGHMTRPYEYYVSIVDAFESFTALDIFLNVNYDKRFQFRFGRYKSPYGYEFYAQPTEALASGEWSVFFNNFGMNRDVGAMFWGESVLDRIDYAVGIFNGTPNAQVDLSNFKSVISFVNFAPFRPRAGSPLENFNIGGSVVGGSQDHVPVPSILRTIVPTAGSNVLGVPFLTFNNDVIVNGPRELWSLHTAYFYRSFMLLAEWQSGFQDYARANGATRVRLPVDGFYVQASYIFTGERMASRGRLNPNRPFDLRRGKFGLGAWEAVFRYADLVLGREVFTAGLADPNIWTNDVQVTDLGVNWYWNAYVHVLFDWQHAEFGRPVVYRPGSLSPTSDLFMLRFQVWF